MASRRCPHCEHPLTDAEIRSLNASRVSDARRFFRGAAPKLSPQQVGAARRMLRAGRTQTEIARHFGVSQSTVSVIANSDPRED